METCKREETKTEVKDDPRARALLRQAFEKTARWQSDFKGFAADLTVNVNRALDLEISINSTGTLTRSGAAVVSGTIACSLDVPIDLDGTALQDRPSGSESGVTSIHGFACNSPSTPWSATVTPNDRRFMAGSATVYVQVGGCGPDNCDFATIETEVQLRRR